MNTHDAWETIHKNRNWGYYPAEHVIRFVARNFYKKERNKVKILDFGCGTGAHTWYLAREGFDAYAFDISETAVAKMEEMLKKEGVRATTSVCDGVELNYKNNFFDAIIDNVSIQSNCIENIKKMYQECFRILSEGGKIQTTVFGKMTTGYGTGRKIEDGTYEGIESGRLQGIGCRHFFEKAELEEILKEVGFKDIRIDSINYTDGDNLIEQFVAIGVK